MFYRYLFFIVLFSISSFSQRVTNPDYSGLAAKFDNVLSSKVLKNTQFGISVYSITNNKSIYQLNSNQILTPASTTKLFTAFAFMQKLGANFKLKTDIYTDGTISNGVLNGDLYIRGGGDALLSINDIEQIADEIIKYGIKEINGNIYGDGTLFDKFSERIDYSGDRDLVQATPPITALSINRNIATVLVSSAASKKNRNTVQVFPQSDTFDVGIDNADTKIQSDKTEPVKVDKSKSVKKNITSTTKVKQPVKTVKSKSKAKKQTISKQKVQPKKKSTNKKHTYITPDIYQKYGEKRKASSKIQSSKKSNSSGTFVSSSINPDGSQKFRVKGRVGSRSSASYSHFIKNPVLTTAGTLKNRLISGGVKINGKNGEKSISEAKNPKKIFSFLRNSFEIIEYFMKHSDNYMSETLFKTLGALTKQTGTDVVSSQNLILHLIDSLSLNCRDCIVNDGSGLSRRNKLSAESMTNLFKVAYNQPYFKYLDSSLALAAFDGTIGNRMWDANTRKNLRAKTGTHGNVSALTGLVKSLDGELFTFAFIFNGPNVNAYKKLENELGIIMANYSRK
jgi:D-alanyl-D-alanine carboxypeptidase